MALIGGFQILAFQPNFQQEEQEPYRVVLFPVEPLRFKRRVDKALYILSVYAKHCAANAAPAFPSFEPRRERTTGFELDPALFGGATL